MYLRTLGITLQISAWTTAFSLLAGYPVAYLLATARPRTRDVLTILVLMPFWTSFLVRTFAWMILLGRNGAVNKLLLALGITDAPLSLIFNFTGTMIGMVHAMMPLAVMAMLSVMQRLDQTLVSAARTLGARGGSAFWQIFFRLSLPGVASAGLLVFISALGFFITPALLGGRQRDDDRAGHHLDHPGGAELALRRARLRSCCSSRPRLVFLLYDRLLGLSSLSGADAGSGDRATAGAARPARRGGRRAAHRGARLAERPRRRDLGKRSSRSGRTVASARPRAACSSSSGALIIAFLCLPSFFVIPVSFTAGNFIEFPPQGFSLRWYALYFDAPDWIAATVRSFVVALLTGAAATVLGTAAAFVLVRQRITGRGIVLGLILAPLVLPRIIIAVGLFYLYARIGLVGTVLGLVIGHTILAVPYVVITVMAVLKTYDERLDQAAWSLGASKWRTLVHITLPQIRGGILAGFLFAFITSFDELTISLFVTGGSTSTLPRRMWNDLLLQVNPTLAAVSTIVLLFVTVFIIAAEVLRRRAVSQ